MSNGLFSGKSRFKHPFWRKHSLSIALTVLLVLFSKWFFEQGSAESEGSQAQHAADEN